MNISSASVNVAQKFGTIIACPKEDESQLYDFLGKTETKQPGHHRNYGQVNGKDFVIISTGYALSAVQTLEGKRELIQMVPSATLLEIGETDEQAFFADPQEYLRQRAEEQLTAAAAVEGFTGTINFTG